MFVRIAGRKEDRRGGGGDWWLLLPKSVGGSLKIGAPEKKKKERQGVLFQKYCDWGGRIRNFYQEKTRKKSFYKQGGWVR